MRVSPAVGRFVVLSLFSCSSGFGRSEEATVNLHIETVTVKPVAVAGWVADIGSTGLAGVLGEQQRTDFLEAMKAAAPDAVDSFATVVRSGERAAVDVVHEFPVQASPGGSGNSERRFEMRDVGVMLAVAPTVAETGSVVLR